MIRVFTTNESGFTKITIDGQLLGDFIHVVAGSVDGAMAEGSPVHLFLRDVPLIDDHGRTLLANLAKRGVRLSARGVYSAYIVGEVGREVDGGGTGASSAGLPRSNISEDQSTHGQQHSGPELNSEANARRPECGLYGV